jgi:hypothetical protein
MTHTTSLFRLALGVLCLTAAAVPRAATAGAYLVSHFLEKSGTTTSATYTFDTVLYFVYPGGQAGIVDGGGATVDLYLFDNNGNALKSGTATQVCNPCSYLLGGSQRKVIVRLDDLIVAKGGFGGGIVGGYALILVNGADPDGVRVSGQQLNSKSNTSDLDIAPLDIQKVSFINLIFADGFETLV